MNAPNPNPYAAPRAAVADISPVSQRELADRIVRSAAAVIDPLVASIGAVKA